MGKLHFSPSHPVLSCWYILRMFPRVHITRKSVHLYTRTCMNRICTWKCKILWCKLFHIFISLVISYCHPPIISKKRTRLHDVLGEDDMELDKKLKRVANWLKIPVYLYIYREVDGPNQLNLSQRCFWVVFEPDGAISETKSDCRFYISLFYNCSQGKGVFDRIIPEKGCNCQNPPPLSLLRNSQSKYIFIRHVFYYFMINKTNIYHVQFYYFVLTFYAWFMRCAKFP